MSYNKPDIKYRGSVSGDVTTGGADQVILMQDGAANNVIVGALAIKCVTDLELKINSETNYHAFLAGETFNYVDVAISQIVIKDSASQIQYKGLYI